MSISSSNVEIIGLDDKVEQAKKKLSQRSLPITLLDENRDPYASPDVFIVYDLNAPTRLDALIEHLKTRYGVDIDNQSIECTRFYSMGQLINLLKASHSNDRLFGDQKTLHVYLEAEKEIQGLIGSSESIAGMKRLIKRLAPSSKPILITGPTGAGKELVAKAIHDMSHFYEGPMVSVNCSAIPENLIESLLFGHEKGAFTGADRRTDGYLKQATHGTLFLDELGEMPIMLQAKLLRVLETGQYCRVGGEASLKFEGRIVTATHVDLEDAVREKRFREDLYYRLNVLTIEVQQLNKRKDDIPLLIEHFSTLSENPIPFTPQAIEYMKRMSWPGNVRELRNAVERLCLLSDNEEITVDCIKNILNIAPQDELEELDQMAQKILQLNIPDKTTTIMNALLLRALRNSSGNKSEAARLLGVHRKVVERRFFANKDFFAERSLDSVHS